MLLSCGIHIRAAVPAVTFTGNTDRIVDVVPERNTGLDHIYVARTVQGLSITAPPMNGKPLLSWQRYDNRGGGYAVEVEGLRTDGDNVILDNPAGDAGYILEWADGKLYFWLTDYASHQLRLDNLSLPAEPDCGMTILTLSGQGDAIHYYSITGRQLTLDRQIAVRYRTLGWNQENLQYTQTDTVEYAESVGQVFISPAPLCNTYFTARGDRFLEVWNAVQEVQSPLWQTNAVEVHTTAVRTNSPGEGSNQIGSGQESGLGGSAPADISFRAYISDAVMHSEWQFSPDPQFNDITHRFNQQDLDYTFRDEGTVHVRFIGSNADGSCTSESETYTVTIGTSELRCPNAFSPGATEGINDEWKVSYRSLIEFKCWIFDRYGTQLFHFTDPEQGWDGKYKGKLVRPGVYFYVIEAKGADGKEYRKGGDINILRYNRNGTGGGTES